MGTCIFIFCKVLLQSEDFRIVRNDRETGDFGESYRLLIDAVAYARTACRLRYMTGGAVVSYGLPIVARNIVAFCNNGNMS